VPNVTYGTLPRVPVMHGPERVRQRGEWDTGIFCELEGDLAGTVAVFLSPRTREAVTELLCGEASPPQEIAASALSEFGNILASQTASAIALESTLSFLGVGLRQTEPSLGVLISNGFEYMMSGRYWISFFPGLALLITIVSINLVGDQLRDVLNPRLKR